MLPGNIEETPPEEDAAAPKPRPDDMEVSQIPEPEAEAEAASTASEAVELIAGESEIAHSMRELLKEASVFTGSQLVQKVSSAFPAFKAFLTSKGEHKELKSKALQCLVEVVTWELPEEIMAMEIISMALCIIADHTDFDIHKWAMKVVVILFESPRRVTDCPGLEAIFGRFEKLIEEQYTDEVETITHIRMLSDVFGIILRHGTYHKPFMKLIPKMEKFFTSIDQEKFEFNYYVTKVACYALRMYNPVTGTDMPEMELFTKNVFNAIAHLLSTSQTYEHRASLMCCIRLIAVTRLNLPLLRYITEGDLLIRLNEGWQHESMVGMCIVSVFIECINNVTDEDFIAVADNCLRLYNVYSSTDDYQMRERLIALLYSFSKRMKKVFDTLKDKDRPFFEKAAEVLLHKATHEIQAMNAPEEMWEDIGFVTFVRSTMPSLISMTANCVMTLSIAELPEKPPSPILTSVCTDINIIQEEVSITDGDTTVITMDEEKLSVRAPEDDEDLQIPEGKRQLTQVESLEIYKSMCCIYEAAATANAVLSKKGNECRSKALLQLHEIHGLIRMSLKMFIGSVRSFVLRQWIKLMIPVVFVMGLKDRFVLNVFDCFRAGYAEIFAPHMLTFILQVLKNKTNLLEYLGDVVSYSEGVLGLFSLGDWEPCSRRLEGHNADAVMDLSQDVANRLFVAFADFPETLTACQNEIMYLTKAVSKLPATKSDRLITVAISMFKGINKVKDSSLAHAILRVPIDVIVRKVARAGAEVHRDWLELMMVTTSRGPFTPELVTICAKPALCILRDFNWDLVLPALEMLESWSECLPCDQFYSLLSRIKIYRDSNFEPQFILCLSKYLQDPSLRHHRKNANIVMNIFSKIGSYASNYVRDLHVNQDFTYKIAIPLNGGCNSCAESKEQDATTYRSSSLKWVEPMQSIPSEPSGSVEQDSPNILNEDISAKGNEDTTHDVLTGDNEATCYEYHVNPKPIGIPVNEGLDSVIRQISSGNMTEEAFEGCADFVINAVAPVMDYDVSLSEVWLNIAKVTNNSYEKLDEGPKYHTQEKDKDFIHALMHAMVKIMALGKRKWNEKRHLRDLESMTSALARYIVIRDKLQSEGTIVASIEPVVLLTAVVDRLVVTWDRGEHNFDLTIEYVEPMETEVATGFLLEVFTQAQSMGCIKLCHTIVTMLCLGCNSYETSRKMGSCVALGRLSSEHPEFMKPMIIDLAQAVAQLSDGDNRAIDVMKDTMEALLKVDEPIVVKWAASLLEHPLWYLRTVGQLCLRAASNQEEVVANIEKLNEVARNLQAPDVQLFLATFKNADLSIIDMAIGAMQPYMQSIVENGDIEEIYRPQAELYLGLLGGLLSNVEYASAVEVMEETFNHVLVYFLKLVIVGSPEIVEKAKKILEDAKNVTVSTKTLSMALEEYIFQLQTIFDEALLDRILEVVKEYRSVVDQALTESLFNVAKALVEGTIHPSVNDEYKNVHFIDYMIFLSSMGAGRACADVIFGQWFKSIDRLKNGVILPGSVAYGIWQVLSYDGVIYSLFNNDMKLECLSFLYFVNSKEDVDYILSDVLLSLASEDHLTNIFYTSLVSWLCEAKLPLVSESKHFNKLVEMMLSLALSTNMQVDDLLTTPADIEDGQILKWKMVYNCASVLFKMVDANTLHTKLSSQRKQDDLSKLDKLIAREFVQRYPLKRKEGMLNPIVGGHIFEMRNYQLKHLLGMLNKEMIREMGNVIDEIVVFCWHSINEGDVMAKLLSICCLSKVVQLFNSPAVGAVAVFKRFVDTIVSEDVFTFLNLHYTVKVDIVTPQGKGTCTLYQLLRDSADILIKALSRVNTPAELWKGIKDMVSSTTKPSVWYALLVMKINEFSQQPHLLVLLFSIFLMYLHDDISMFALPLLDMLKFLDSNLFPNMCNLVQGGALDAFFAVLAVTDKHDVKMDATWVMKSCIKNILASIVSYNMGPSGIEPYMPFIVKLFVKAPHFDVFGHSLKQVTMKEISFPSFNQSHLLGNPYCHLDSYKQLGSRRSCRDRETRRGRLESKAKKLELDKKRYHIGGTVILNIISHVLDYIIPDATGIRKIADELTSVWYLKNESTMKLAQVCIFKLTCILRNQFGNTDRPLLNPLTSTELQKPQQTQGANEGSIKTKPEESKTDFDDLGCSVNGEEKQASVTDAYLDPFPKWLIGLILDEFKAAQNVEIYCERDEEEDDEPMNLVCHYLETTAISYVETPRSSTESGKNTPSGSFTSLSRMSSSNPNDGTHEAKQVPESEVGLSLSTAMRTMLTMLKALSPDTTLMLQVLKDLLPTFLDLINPALQTMPDLEHVFIGAIRLAASVYVITELPPDLMLKDYDRDGSKRLGQIIELLIWALPELDEGVKQQVLDVVQHFTLISMHPFNATLVRILGDLGETAVDIVADLNGSGKRQKVKQETESPSRSVDKRKPATKTEGARRAKRACLDSMVDNSQKSDSSNCDIMKFVSIAEGQKDSIKWIELKNLIKGTGKTYPRQLLEKGIEIKVISQHSEIVLPERHSLIDEKSFVDLVRGMHALYNIHEHKIEVLLETLYCMRHVSANATLAEKYHELMLNILDMSGIRGRHIRNKLIAYLSCAGKNDIAFMDAYEELEVPTDLFSLAKYVLSSEICFNRDSGFYIPLYLDIIFTCSLDDWDVSVTECYPCLPMLIAKDNNVTTRQIDLICQEEPLCVLKPNVMLLKQFRGMQGITTPTEEHSETKGTMTFEVMNEGIDVLNDALRKMHQFHLVFFQRIVKVSNFRQSIRKMWHSDKRFASRIWESVFPQVHTTFTTYQQDEIAKAVCSYLSREEHLSNRSEMSLTIVRGMIKCHPPVYMPPELMKYLALTFGAWDEVICHLEKQLFFQPLDTNRVASVLADIYELLNMKDMATGAYRSMAITQETRLAICFLQHAKWKQGQREFNSIMESLALAGQTAEAVSTFDESKLWYSGWAHATKQLGEWDLLRDVSFVAGDQKLFMQSSAVLQDWGEIVPEDGLNDITTMFTLDEAEFKVNKAYHQLHTDLLTLNEVDSEATPPFILKCGRKAEALLKEVKTKVLHSWSLLPKGLSEAHYSPMQMHQKLVEIDEGLNYVVDVMNSIDKGNVTESPPLLNKWRQRMPRPGDLPSVWTEMLSWRTFLFTTVRSILINNHSISEEMRINASLNLQDLQWTLTKYASITRKAHQLPLIASVILNKAQKFHKSITEHAKLVSEDCLVIMIERIKQYLSIPVNVHDALKGVISMDLGMVPSVGCETLKSHALRLMAEAINRKSAYELPKRQSTPEIEMAGKYLIDALKLEPMVSKNWISWAKYNDKRIDHIGVSQGKATDTAWQTELYESAITGYLAAVAIRPHCHWLLLGRVIILLNQIRGFIKTGTCSEAFKTYSDMIPISVWYLWLPQLISGVNRCENLEFNHILQLLLYRLPQQVFYSLRCEYFAQNATTDADTAVDTTQNSTMKRLLSTLIASSPSVGTMLESFAATVTHMGRPDFVDEIIGATESIFEDCLDLPFNERVPSQVLNYISLKMSHRSSMLSEGGEVDLYISQMMKELEATRGTLTCGETMNLLLTWISRLKEVSKTSHMHQLQKRIQCVKMHQFCQHLQMLNMELYLPTLQPSNEILKPKHRHCLGECVGVVSLLPEVKKRKRGMQIVKSISILAQNGQFYVYTVQPLILTRQKSDQHVSQMIKLLNHYALKYNETRRRDIEMPVTNVVSLDPYLCLYEEDPKDETMSNILSKSVSFKNLVSRMPDVKSYIHSHPAMYNETNMLLLIMHKMIMELGVTHELLQRWRTFNPESVEELTFTRVYQMFKEKQYPWFTTWYKKTHQEILMDAYSQLCSLVPDDILVKHAMKRLDSYQDFMTIKTRITRSYALQALLGLMFVTPYVTPCKLSLNFNSGVVRHLDFRLNYSRDIFVEYSKLRVFRFTRNIKTIIGPICRMGLMPAVMYSMCAAVHTYKLDIIATLSTILTDDFAMVQSTIETPRDTQDPQPPVNQAPAQQTNQRPANGGGSHPSTPIMMAKREVNPLDEYIGRVLSYCSYLRSPTDQEPSNMPINNIICCIIDASADSATLGKLKTSYQPWF